MKRSAVKAETFTVEVRDSKGNEKLRWVICQHCRKPVYGVLLTDAYLPNEKIIKKWIWKGKTK